MNSFKFLKLYRRFTHNIEYKDGFYKNIMMILISLLLLNLLILYLVW